MPRKILFTYAWSMRQLRVVYIRPTCTSLQRVTGTSVTRRICACDWRATCPALVKNYMKTRPGLGLHLTMDSSCFLLRQLEIYGGSLCEPPSADMLIMFMRYEAKQTQFITHCQHHYVDTTISTSNHWVDHLVDYSTESRDELVP